MTSDIVTSSPANAAVSPAHALGQVADDWQAADVWLSVLAARPASPQTLETYGREVRRLRWYCETQGAPMPRGWSYQDALQYVRFLTEQAANHIRPAGLRHGAPGWTPFLGALSESSVADARKILHTLFKFWMNAGYVAHNPFAGQAGRARRATAPSRRALPETATDLVLTCLDARPKATARDHLRYYRDRFVFLLVLHTGIRAHEAAAATMGDVEPRTDPQTHRLYWALRLRTQKGGGEGSTLLNKTVMAAFHEYRQAYRLPATPEAGDGTALILSPYTNASAGGPHAAARRHNALWRPVRTRQAVYNIIKDVLKEAVDAARAEHDEATATVLLRASTHWLRHTRATTLLMKGADVRLVAKAMRHTDVRTTMNYTDLDFLDVARAIDDE